MAGMAPGLKRVKKESEQAIVPELGIYLEPLQLDSSSQLPIDVHVLLVSLHTHAVPNLVKYTFGINYTYLPPSVKFLSRLPHPLISDDGAMDIDVLNSQWSPALSARTLLTSLQSVLANPTDSHVLLSGCVRNDDWELGAFATPPQHAPILFDLLFKACRPPDDGSTPCWFSWRFLRGLRSLLCMHPLAYISFRRAWYGCLRSLANACVTYRGYILPPDPTAQDEAKRMWIQETQALLKKHFRFDSLRAILCSRSLGGSLGSMQRINRVWSIIRVFISDIEDEELFASNRFLLRLVMDAV